MHASMKTGVSKNARVGVRTNSKVHKSQRALADTKRSTTPNKPMINELSSPRALRPADLLTNGVLIDEATVAVSPAGGDASRFTMADWTGSITPGVVAWDEQANCRRRLRREDWQVVVRHLQDDAGHGRAEFGADFAVAK